MKNKLFYVFLLLALINVLVNGMLNFFNLVTAGIIIGVMAGKKKSGDFSLWKLIVGVTIASCSILIGLVRIYRNM